MGILTNSEYPDEMGTLTNSEDPDEMGALKNSKDLNEMQHYMKCSIMLHFIRVCTVC